MKKDLKKFTAALLSLAVICTGANGISSYTKAAKKPTLKLSKSSTLTKGQTKKLKITTSGIKKIVSVKWKSSKKSVVKITKSSGKTATIEARKTGKAVIRANVKYKVKSSSKTTSKKIKCTVTVEATPDTTTFADIIPTTFGENMIEATVNGTRTLFFYDGDGSIVDDGLSYKYIGYISFTKEGKPQYRFWFTVPNKTGTYHNDAKTCGFSMNTSYDSVNDKWNDYFSDLGGYYGSITVDSVDGQTLTGTFETTLKGTDIPDINNYTKGMPDIVITNGRFHFTYGQKHDVIKKWEELKANSEVGSSNNSNVANPGDVGNSDVGSSNDRRTCGTCRGTGKITCTYCSGKGYTEKTYMPPFGGKVETIQTRCTHCSQTGRENCYVCNGKGWW